MLRNIVSGQTEILILDNNDVNVGMPKASLSSHMKKHPDIASTPEEYLTHAYHILKNGKDYKNGKVHDGVFARVLPSTEINGYMVYTVHRKFPC